MAGGGVGVEACDSSGRGRDKRTGADALLIGDRRSWAGRADGPLPAGGDTSLPFVKLEPAPEVEFACCGGNRTC